MIDPFGRKISYLRVSVTDRCDFRCVYCMTEHMTFLPKADLLTLEELERLCGAFIEKGVERIRITGGEPLVRRDVMSLFENLGRRLGDGLKELTLTTNGSQLARHASELAGAGVRRVNVSLDTRDAEKFRAVTRGGDLAKVLAGIDAAQRRGKPRASRSTRLRCATSMKTRFPISWNGRMGGPCSHADRDHADGRDRWRARGALSAASSLVRAGSQQRYTLDESDYRTGGPARYVRVRETGGRLGFITPLTHNFCESCNRVRLTCTGTLYMCLGQEDAADFRARFARDASDSALT